MLEARRQPIVKTDSGGGSTAGQIWNASRVFADVLLQRPPGSENSQRTFLELGCGTGYLALRLAAAVKGTKVIATDMPNVMKPLRQNVNRNHLGHAIRCVAWDWNGEAPCAIDWGSVTHCIAVEVIYYNESSGNSSEALARAIATVFERGTASIEVLLKLDGA